MLFNQDDIAMHSQGLNEVDTFCIKTVCKMLNDFEESGLSSLKLVHRKALLPVMDEARRLGGANVPRETLIALWGTVNAIRNERNVTRDIAPLDQKKMAERLEDCLPSFEHTRKGEFARSLLRIASERRWTRAEYNRAHQYVLEIEHPED